MDGILIVDKPKGCTSHDIVDLVRRRFKIKKVGHAGTLDPMATGVLVILVGGYTKLAGRFLGDDKEYDATLTLGATSDTADACGKITLSDKPFSAASLKNDAIEEAFKKFLGHTEQMPPAYSAVKFKGKKLYELARSGVSVKVEPRKIFIERIEISKIDIPNISFKVVCSKGTYIRQLSEDVGSALGCGAYLSRLCRTRSGRFLLEDAVTVEEIRNATSEWLKTKLKTQ